MAYIHFDSVTVVFLKKNASLLIRCFYDSDLNFRINYLNGNNSLEIFIEEKNILIAWSTILLANDKLDGRNKKISIAVRLKNTDYMDTSQIFL